MSSRLLRRPIALAALVPAIVLIVIGRAGHHTPIAIAGYALIVIAIVLGLVIRR